MASHWQGNAVLKLMQRHADAIDLDTDASIKAMLTGTGHVPNPDDSFVSDGGADDADDFEATGTNYTGGFNGSGRHALASKTTTYNTSTNRGIFDGADELWTAYNPTSAAAHLEVIKEITSDALSPIIINLDFASVDPNGNDLVVQYHADGIGYIAV